MVSEFKMTTTSLLVLALILPLRSLASVASKTETLPFWECSSDVPVPTRVMLKCERLFNGICLLKKGQTYALEAEFTPGVSTSDKLQSYVAWKRWVEMPIPGQTYDACPSFVKCPLTHGVKSTFKYPLEVQNFWMRRRYPMVWRLTDEVTHRDVFCFIIRTQII
ncbi:NPC intracellular cholesterol transporter 2-like [Palaemon carinicauda]|uniref:NPC intracellular cholesterol transporter 2-like n=1 Tax=Palaemon carinicauda TaxID=392227 RepID=UPI0035B6824D